jgi:hypothetical protein
MSKIRPTYFKFHRNSLNNPGYSETRTFAQLLLPSYTTIGFRSLDHNVMQFSATLPNLI